MAGVKNITVIPAKKRVGNTVTAEDKPKLKVVRRKSLQWRKLY